MRVFLLQESFSLNKNKTQETQTLSRAKKKEKVYFLVFVGEKTVAFVLAQEYPHFVTILSSQQHFSCVFLEHLGFVL